MVLDGKVYRRKVQWSSSNTHQFFQMEWSYKVSQPHEALDSTEQKKEVIYC